MARKMCCELVTWSVRDICCPKYEFLTAFGLLGVIVTNKDLEISIYQMMGKDTRVEIDYSLDLRCTGVRCVTVIRTMILETNRLSTKIKLVLLLLGQFVSQTFRSIH